VSVGSASQAKAPRRSGAAASELAQCVISDEMFNDDGPVDSRAGREHRDGQRPGALMHVPKRDISL
jgi:hypothetical protein